MANTKNQTIRIGPKILPIPEVPLTCTANSAVSRSSVTGITAPPSAGAATPSPSTAASTLIAGRNDTVAEKQTGPEHQRPKKDHDAALLVAVQQSVECEYATLAVVLRAQHEAGVLDGNDDGDRPDHEGNAAEHVLVVRGTPP